MSLRVVVATPLSEELCELIEQREPRVELVRDQSLLPPAMHAGDHDGDPGFTRSADQEREFERMIDSAEALYGLPGESPDALRRTVEANPALRWVHTTPAGGGAQVRAARLSPDALERVAFTQSGGVHAQPLAEFALLGILSGARRVGRLRSAQARRDWAPRETIPLLSEQTVVVVGLGGIGRATAALLASLGMRVIGIHRREVDAPGVERILPVERLAEALADADGVVLALPSTAATRGMLSREVLAAVKPGITVVNVGRGRTVDEPALIEALEDGRVGFAALDVFAQEPLPVESALWAMHNVLISPHSAAMHQNEDRLIAELFAENATRLLDGQPLKNRVNIHEFY